MKYTILLLIPFFLSGCSFYGSANYIAPSKIEGALNAELYDWEVDFPVGASFGNVAPEMYGFKFEDNYFFIYPRSIGGFASTGPLLLPFIPVGGNFEDEIQSKVLFDIRVLDPTNTYSVFPTKLSLFSKEISLVSCKLIVAKTDSAGKKYECETEQSYPNSVVTKIMLSFNNNQTISVPLEEVKVSSYAPIFSFNGPNLESNPKVTITENGATTVYGE